MKLLAAVCLIAFTTHAGEGGTLIGVAKFEGKNVPQPRFHQIRPQDRAGCPHEKVPDLCWVVNPANLGVRNVVVRVMDVELPPPEVPFQAPKISLEGCIVTPRVSIIPPLSKVDVLNPDGIAHNIHNVPCEGNNQPFMRLIAVGVKEFQIPAEFHKKQDRIVLQCFAHPWMQGLAIVHDPRLAAISDADGKFTISNIPPGKHKVIFNHEQGGEQEFEFEIKAGEVTHTGDILFKVR